MSGPEYIVLVLIIVVVVLMIYYVFKERIEPGVTIQDMDTIPFLCTQLIQSINEIVNTEIHTLRLNQRDMENRKILKRTLREAIRRCSYGDLNAKRTVLFRAKHTLANLSVMSEEYLDRVIPFSMEDKLSARDKFDIILYLFKREGHRRLFRELSAYLNYEKRKEEGGSEYRVDEEDISEAYHRVKQSLSFDDKLNILTQRVYEETYGLSVVDLLLMEDSSIDGLSGGVSGKTLESFRYMENERYEDQYQPSQTHKSIWVLYQGKGIHLKFLAFSSKETFIRICKNLSEHGRRGHFTDSEGGMRSHLADGSRITVFRPNNASQWAFFIRKFTTTVNWRLEDLITDPGCRYPIDLICWAIKGCINLFFSGDQNSGKTTNVRAAIYEIDSRQAIRALEADFELYLNDAYPDKNILSVRPSDRLPFGKLIELLKASDAHTILFGETANLEHAKHLIDLLLAGTKRIITTGHWPTTDELVSYFIHAMGGYGGNTGSDIESLISRLVHLDIHCVKGDDGHRYIERITEVIPSEKEEGNKAYDVSDIIRYENGEYRAINPVSRRLSRMIQRNLSKEQGEEYLEFNQRLNELSKLPAIDV